MFDGLTGALSSFFGFSDETSSYGRGARDRDITWLAYAAAPVLFLGATKLYTMIRGWLSDAYADETKRKDALSNVERTLQLFDEDNISKLKTAFPKSAAAAKNVVAQLKAAKAELEKEPKEAR